MLQLDGYEVKIRNVMSGKDQWYQVLFITLLPTDKGPFPCIGYLNTESELALAIGSPVLRRKEQN